MRRTRRLILLLITAILVTIGVIYSVQRETQARNAPTPPSPLPKQVSARANEWTFEKTDGRPIVRIFAKNFRQVAEGTKFELEDVTLHLFHKDGKVYDEVKSKRADYDVGSEQLFSEGEVEIRMGVQASTGQPSGNLVKIKSSGVSFDGKNGSASTARPASFQFSRGEGSCTGARYDPSKRELQMHADVKLTWWGEKPDVNRMEIEAGSLVYNETTSQAVLTPWTKFKRGTLAVDAEGSTVTVADGSLKQVEATKAQGTDNQPKRQLQFGSDHLLIHFNDQGNIEKLTGSENARLTSMAAAAHTQVNSKRVDLDFDPAAPDTVLTKVLATGGATVESKPAVRSATMPETRIVKSDVIALQMRKGGEEIERVETHAPGSVEFVPNRAGQKKRFIHGDRLIAQYGVANQVQSFHATQASTRTETPVGAGSPARPPSLTWSNNLSADFNQTTGAMERLEQWDDFRYEEGDRRAKAQKALAITAADQIKLTGAARFWDSAGSTSADTIVMNQKSGDMEADGNVNSTRLPEKKKKQDGLLAADQPLYAKAARMTTQQENTRIQYEGDALMWQGANRLQAAKIDIDRRTGLLEANGNVVSQLLDSSSDKNAKAKPDPKTAAMANQLAAKTSPAKPKEQVFTIVRSPRMTYSDKDRVAHYTGGAVLQRETTVVNAEQIRAYLTSGEDSSLEKAIADGNVKIVQTAPDRTKTGTSEHAEYYPDEGRVLLAGGQPTLVDTVKGDTRGTRLTYFSNSDRLLVEGGQQQPVKSKLLRK